MKTSNLLNIAYISILSLGLMSAAVNASERTLPNDDDSAITNVGIDNEARPHVNTLKRDYSDDDKAIFSVGRSGHHVAHHQEISVDEYLDDDLSIVNTK